MGEESSLEASIVRPECIEVLEHRIPGLEVESASEGQVTLKSPYPALLSRGEWERLYGELISRGCKPVIRIWRGYTVVMLSLDREEKGGGLYKGLILALLTILTLYMSGAYLADSLRSYSAESLRESPILVPWLYVIGLLGPLLIHELGHWSMMRLYRTPSSLPYLIPAPPLQWGFLGTFGAVINMRWIPPTVDSLAIVGVMGPLAGFIAAIPVTVYGLMMSPVVPASMVPPGGYLQVYPLIFLFLGSRFLPNPGEDSVVLLHPLAFAGYIVFLVTFLNLIPIGQLDGGHVIRSCLGDEGHRKVSMLFLVLLLGLSVVESFLLLFAFIAFGLYLLSRGRHPGPATPVEDLSVKGQLAVIVYFVLLFLTFPLPLF